MSTEIQTDNEPVKFVIGRPKPPALPLGKRIEDAFARTVGRDQHGARPAAVVVTLTIPIASIRQDGGTQPRVAMSPGTTDEYKELVEAGVEMSPIDVYFDDTNIWLADGFHRVAAHIAAGKTEIAARVRKGGQRDAILASVGANATHGLRRTNADKRRAVETLLRDEEWSKKSSEMIAEKCFVSRPFVDNIRNEQAIITGAAPTPRLGKDGIERKLPKKKPTAKKPASVINLAAVREAQRNDDEARHDAFDQAASDMLNAGIAGAFEPADEPSASTPEAETVPTASRRQLPAIEIILLMIEEELSTYDARDLTAPLAKIYQALAPFEQKKREADEGEDEVGEDEVGE